MNFNSILIGSDNEERLAEYYGKLFGKPQYQEQGFSSWQIGSGWVTVGPHSDVRGKNAAPGRLIWNLETGDVKGDFDKLRAAGATVVAEPYRAGEEPEMWIATLSDPDGNYFQLMSEIEMPQS